MRLQIEIHRKCWFGRGSFSEHFSLFLRFAYKFNFFPQSKTLIIPTSQRYRDITQHKSLSFQSFDTKLNYILVFPTLRWVNDIYIEFLCWIYLSIMFRINLCPPNSNVCIRHNTYRTASVTRLNFIKDQPDNQYLGPRFHVSLGFE